MGAAPWSHVAAQNFSVLPCCVKMSSRRMLCGPIMTLLVQLGSILLRLLLPHVVENILTSEEVRIWRTVKKMR
jgi:hypothetical protein